MAAKRPSGLLPASDHQEGERLRSTRRLFSGIHCAIVPFWTMVVS